MINQQLAGKEFKAMEGIHIEIYPIDGGMVSHTPWFIEKGDTIRVVQEQGEYYVVNEDISEEVYHFFETNKLYVSEEQLEEDIIPKLKQL